MTALPRLLFLHLLFTGFLCAQDGDPKPQNPEDLKHPVHPALFKIEGKELKKPSYLFGTIHLGDPRVTTLHPDAEKAFESADRFYAEVDLDPGKMIGIAGRMMRKDGKTLSKSIGPDLTKKLDAALKEINPALSSQPFEPMKTWVMVSQLPLLQFQLEGKQPLDAVLYQRAKEGNKKVNGLETIESQLEIFDDLKEEEQVLMLKSALDTMAEEKKEGKNSTKKLLHLYLTANIPDLGTFVRETMEIGDTKDEATKELNDRILKKLLDDRNIKMAKAISDALVNQSADTHFFAVGAAHYVGPTAIQSLLAKEGFTITPLFK